MFGLPYGVVDNAISRTFDSPHVRRGERYEVADVKPELLRIAENEIGKNQKRMEKWTTIKEALLKNE